VECYYHAVFSSFNTSETGKSVSSISLEGSKEGPYVSLRCLVSILWSVIDTTTEDLLFLVPNRPLQQETFVLPFGGLIRDGYFHMKREWLPEETPQLLQYPPEYQSDQETDCGSSQ
jgi:hypothetical protein